jgi:hypothetical protein
MPLETEGVVRRFFVLLHQSLSPPGNPVYAMMQDDAHVRRQVRSFIMVNAVLRQSCAAASPYFQAGEPCCLISDA